MKYMLLLTFEPGSGPQEGTPEYDAEMERWSALNEEMRRAGVYVLATGLQLPDSATTLRRRGGELAITDGPFVETKEVAFSFYVIDVSDLDAATEWAGKTPHLDYGSVEIRPTVGFEAE